MEISPLNVRGNISDITGIIVDKELNAVLYAVLILLASFADYKRIKGCSVVNEPLLRDSLKLRKPPTVS